MKVHKRISLDDARLDKVEVEAQVNSIIVSDNETFLIQEPSSPPINKSKLFSRSLCRVTSNRRVTKGMIRSLIQEGTVRRH
mgnify:CR=1 FL=1